MPVVNAWARAVALGALVVALPPVVVLAHGERALMYSRRSGAKQRRTVE